MASGSGNVDISQLSESQQSALQQYIAVTNQEIPAAIPLLQRSQWNIQIAIAKFFDGEQPDAIAEAIAEQNFPRRRSPQQENLQESFLRQSASSRRNLPEQAPKVIPDIEDVARRPPFILSLIFAPINLLLSLLVGPWKLFTYLFPFLPRLLSSTNTSASGRRDTTGRRALCPRDAAARFKREFEEEYGENDLRFFENGGYVQALDVAKKELKILLVIFFSPEHDDNSSFVRETLLSPSVTAYFNDPSNKIMIWAGNIQDSEAYKIAGAFKCTKFPFSVLVGRIASGTPIIGRLAGVMTPQTYLAGIQEAVTKFKPQLEALEAERTAQASERNLRNDQDSAYERSLAQDRARAEQRRRAEAEAAAAAQLAAEKEAKERDLERKTELWRRWRASSLRPEPGAEVKEVVRIGLKLPGSAGRITRRFHAESSIEELYAFVECHDLLKGEAEVQEAEKPGGFEMEFRFRLVSPMPRQVYLPEEEGTILQKIGRSGNLIVEEVLDEEEGE